MTCLRCGYYEMYREDDRRAGVVVHVCCKCGNRIYQGFPQSRKTAVRSKNPKTLREGCSGQ